jgi:hypothetical protein
LCNFVKLGSDSSDDNIFIPKRKWVDSKTSNQQKATGEVLQASRTGEKRVNSEQMRNQDNDASDEGAEEEAEVTICWSPHSKSNGKT